MDDLIRSRPGAGGPADAPAETVPATTPVPLVAPRPRRVRGQTWQVQSPLGKVYVTLNLTDEGEPFEIFVRVGKSGTDIEAFAEALGRLMSNFLRYTRLPDRRTRLAKIIEQFSGIGGASHVGFGPHRVRSVPDAIAKALSEFLAPDEGDPLKTRNGAGGSASATRPTGDICPSCGNATLAREDGGKTCQSCSSSEG